QQCMEKHAKEKAAPTGIVALGVGQGAVSEILSHVSPTSRLEYLSDSINQELGLIELKPVTAVWNNDDLAVRGKAGHLLLLRHRGCGGIAGRKEERRRAP